MKAIISILALAMSLATAGATARTQDDIDQSTAGGIGIESVTGVTSQCVVATGGTGTYSSVCRAVNPQADGYVVIFQIYTPTGGVPTAGQYTYQWQIPAASGQTTGPGCTSTSSFCTIDLSPQTGIQLHNTISTIVTEVSTSSSITVSSRYFILATCGNTFC